MSDLIRREYARLIALDYISDSMERHGALEAIRALPAVQPDTAPASNLTARGNAATWALYDANLTRMGAVQPDPLCECGMTGPCKWTECKAPILSAHVNETPKSEHDARDVLTPATKGGDA